MNKDKNKENKDSNDADWMEQEDYSGQLAIDAFQTHEDVIVKAPIAGVSPDDLEISITDDTVSVKGQRRESQEVERDNYFCQECYWGSFARTFTLPVAVDPDHAKASLKNGILTIIIPKQEKTKIRTVKVNLE